MKNKVMSPLPPPTLSTFKFTYHLSPAADTHRADVDFIQHINDCW